MAKKKILAVDDDSTALGALRQILAQKGYDVTTAGNGEDALGILAGEATFDLIILDVAMPGMTGYEVCRSLRKEKRRSRFAFALSSPWPHRARLADRAARARRRRQR